MPRGSAARFNHDGSILATGSADGVVRLWDTTDTAGAEWIAFSAPSTDVAYDPSGRRIAAAALGEGSGTLKLVNNRWSSKAMQI